MRPYRRAWSRRLRARWQALERRGKLRTIVAVAVASQLAGHCWAPAAMEEPQHQRPARRAGRHDATSDPRYR
jgi:hypothetical protein